MTTDSPASGTPLVVLDVDGVIVPLKRFAEQVEPGWVETSAGFPLRVRQEVLDALVELDALATAGVVDVVWCTTWKDQAPDHFGSWFGRGWPLVQLIDGPDSSWHKARGLVRWLQKNPHGRVLWFDDDAGKHRREVGKVARLCDLTVVSPHDEVGLTDEHLALIRSFTAPEGVA